jgi:dihydroorotate dehydrogenase
LLTLNKIKKENKTDIPLLLKVSPDIKDNHISEIVDVAIKNDIAAIILTNTTNGNRDNLRSEVKKEEGGLSGEPLQQISTNMIKIFYKQLNGKIPIIGVGGVNSGKSAYEKIIAGASLLQLYTSFIYRGPSIAKDIKKELIQILKTEGLSNIKEAIGRGA